MKLTIFFFIAIAFYNCSSTNRNINNINSKNEITSKQRSIATDSINFSNINDTIIQSNDSIPYIQKIFLLKQLYSNIRTLNKNREYVAAIHTEKKFIKSYNKPLKNNNLNEFFDITEQNSIYNAFINEYNLTISKLDSVNSNVLIDKIATLYDIENDTNKISLPKNILEQNFTIPISINDKVLSMIYFFTHRGRKIFNSWFQRKAIYEKTIYEILNKYHLPNDLIYIAMIESGFKTSAKSRVKAVGMWQFMKETGKIYNLNCGYWVDERRDYIKSTMAAAEYMTYLHSKFNSWYLAFASYNWGSYRTNRLIKKYKTKNFWNLYYFFPKETRMYVTTFISVMIISHNAEYFGFKKNDKYKSLKYKTVLIDGGLLINYLASCAQTTKDTILFYNPELTRGCTPANEKKYLLKIPENKYNIFLKNYAKKPKKAKILYVKHKLKNGDSIYKLSKIYKTPMNSILAANKLSKKSILRIGKSIIIPVPVSALQ